MKINQNTTYYYTINNTIYGVLDVQSFDDATVDLSLFIVPPSIRLIHYSTNLSTKLFLQTQFL